MTVCVCVKTTYRTCHWMFTIIPTQNARKCEAVNWPLLACGRDYCRLTMRVRWIGTQSGQSDSTRILSKFRGKKHSHAHKQTHFYVISKIFRCACVYTAGQPAAVRWCAYINKHCCGWYFFECIMAWAILSLQTVVWVIVRKFSLCWNVVDKKNSMRAQPPTQF